LKQQYLLDFLPELQHTLIDLIDDRFCIEVCLLLAERQENQKVHEETGLCVILNIEHSPERYRDICLNPLVRQTELLVLRCGEVKDCVFKVVYFRVGVSLDEAYVERR